MGWLGWFRVGYWFSGGGLGTGAAGHTVLESIPIIASIIPRCRCVGGGDPTLGGGGTTGTFICTYIYIYKFIDLGCPTFHVPGNAIFTEKNVRLLHRGSFTGLFSHIFTTFITQVVREVQFSSPACKSQRSKLPRAQLES